MATMPNESEIIKQITNNPTKYMYNQTNYKNAN